MISLRNLINRRTDRGLVKMSASWSVVDTGKSCMIRFRTCSRKWWYTIFMCFVRGRSLGVLASSNVPELSSKALQYTAGTILTGAKLISFNSLRRLITGMTSQGTVIVKSILPLWYLSLLAFARQISKLLGSQHTLPDTQYVILQY